MRNIQDAETWVTVGDRKYLPEKNVEIGMDMRNEKYISITLF